jgi:hypothetical protein
MIVEKFRKYFPAHAEKNDLDFARIDKYKTLAKTGSCLGKLFCKEISTPFTKVFAFLNYLSFENIKFKRESSNLSFWNFRDLKLDEASFNIFEAQANLALQPLCLFAATSQAALEILGLSKENSSTLRVASTLSSVAVSSTLVLNVILSLRKALTAKKSISQSVTLLRKENAFNCEVNQQLYKTFLDTGAAALKILNLFAPKNYKYLLSSLQACVCLLQTPEKLDNCVIKIETATKKHERRILKELEKLSTQEISTKDFLDAYKRLYKEIENSTNVTTLNAFKQALERKMPQPATAPAA